MTKYIVILCGIPTSGKSTWTKKFIASSPDSQSVSRDEIRENLFGKDYWKRQANKRNYAYSITQDEKFITQVFDKTVRTLLEGNTKHIILDNTHCKESYLTQAISKYEKEGCVICIKFFKIPMWKAYYRNIVRYLGTGKWIPFKVLHDMQKNYNKIDKKKYNEKYVVL